MPYTLNFTIATFKPFRQFAGVPLHAMIHNAIASKPTYAALAQALHQSSVMPFSLQLSPPQQGSLSYSLKLLDEELIEVFLDTLRVGYQFGNPDDALSGFIQGLEFSMVPFEALMNMPAKVSDTFDLTLPVCTRLTNHAGFHLPAALDSLLQRIKSLQLPLLDFLYSYSPNLNDLLKALTHATHAETLVIARCRQNLGKKTVQGFKGQLTLTIKDPLLKPYMYDSFNLPVFLALD